MQPGDWVEADLRDLIAAAPLRPVTLTALDEVIVITLGVLARGIIRRALLFGCTVELAPVTRQPLQGESPAVGAMLMRIRWRRERIPQAFLHSLLRLPATAVTRALGVDSRLSAETGREGEQACWSISAISRRCRARWSPRWCPPVSAGCSAGRRSVTGGWIWWENRSMAQPC